jgi:hypothetical protein
MSPLKAISRVGRVLPFVAGGVKAIAKVSHRAGRFRGRREGRRSV